MTAKLDLSKPQIMGILNVTPDSFSDGGHFYHLEAALDQAEAMIKQGATIIDVGGESTRPGSDPVDVDEEMRRVLPVIAALVAQGACVSIDTRNAVTMAAAVEAGASMINDVMALREAGSLDVAASLNVPVVLMHCQGNPKTMQKSPKYKDVVKEVYDFLQRRIWAAEQAGIDEHNICIDVGIGFGKTLAHNTELLRHVKTFEKLKCPQVVGVSRKSFITKIVGEVEPEERLGGSIAAALFALQQGVKILRVHDVVATKQAMDVWLHLEAA